MSNETWNPYKEHSNLNPQPEREYTRVVNVLLEGLAKFNLSGVESNIVFCLLRETYGWNRSYVSMSYSQIAEKTSNTVIAVRKALQFLSHTNIILCYKGESKQFMKGFKGKHSGSPFNTFAINKYTDTWVWDFNRKMILQGHLKFAGKVILQGQLKVILQGQLKPDHTLLSIKESNKEKQTAIFFPASANKNDKEQGNDYEAEVEKAFGNLVRNFEDFPGHTDYEQDLSEWRKVFIPPGSNGNGTAYYGELTTPLRKRIAVIFERDIKRMQEEEKKGKFPMSLGKWIRGLKAKLIREDKKLADTYR